MGTRVLDVRVQEDRRICHGVLATYAAVDAMPGNVRRFLGETESEVVILEVRTELGHKDPPGFAKSLVDKLSEENLIAHDEAVFHKTIAELLLPRRVICVWKPSNSPAPRPGETLWSAGYLKGNWIDTDLPETKFQSNLKFLGQQAHVADRRFFYRVGNTVTPQADNPMLCVWPAFAKGSGDKLQVFSTDFIDGDFVDACAGRRHQGAPCRAEIGGTYSNHRSIWRPAYESLKLCAWASQEGAAARHTQGQSVGLVGLAEQSMVSRSPGMYNGPSIAVAMQGTFAEAPLCEPELVLHGPSDDTALVVAAAVGRQRRQGSLARAGRIDLPPSVSARIPSQIKLGAPQERREQ
ncbi:hypothetical protein HU200_059827 [Digitaria exilis]|uniref:Uncharacterized protein n=1 Tax=Digitaria exilis TaxID=1010633 RepID=A0A835AFJ1_9POAL|nr:hypothetical protein HU200_059827 [Digitaria exilis]